jgi:hypothetical protein
VHHPVARRLPPAARLYSDREAHYGGQVAGPTLLRERSENAQVWLAVIVPLVFGTVVGIFLGTSATVYWILLVVAALGALLSGLEHEQVKEAAGRGAVAGAMFGLGILAAHQLAGTDAKVDLGSFPAALILIDAIAGALLAALGCWLSGRRRTGRARSASS